MALVTCPECGRKNVSNTAVACPDCGYAIKEHFERIKAEEKRFADAKAAEAQRKADAEDLAQRLKESEPQRKQEAIQRVQKQKSVATRNIVCGVLTMCFFPLAVVMVKINGGAFIIILCIICGLVGLYNFANGLKERKTAIKNLDMISTDLERVEASIAAKERQKEEARKRLQEERDRERILPVCPLCGSKNTERISTMNRATSVAMTGLASGKIGKQYKCKNCKHMW